MYRLGKLLFILFIFLFSNSYCQNYNISSIPDSLYENANSIIRTDITNFTINAIDNALLEEHLVITILNKSGENNGVFYEYYDPFRILKIKKANIYDSSGKLIKKIKSKDIKDFSAVSNSSKYDDNRVKYIKPLVTHYPYTVEYLYTIQFKGLINFKEWHPVSAYDIAVEKSSFLIDATNFNNFRIKKININNDSRISYSKVDNVYKWELSGFKAIESEPYSLYLSETTPGIIIAPNEFSYDKHEGKMENWKEFGNWFLGLVSEINNKNPFNKEDIPLLFAIDSLTNDPYEKAKIIYNYVQSNTRYVSVQLGIGGWQPFPVNKVNELGYGDCKALANYTNYLLNISGIKSFYALVKANSKSNIDKNFTYNQFNHVILCIPFENQDTVWLECTNQNIPFGYL
ncbi:MAG: DUF3857 and transglutaminase domain-containing protein, partial [Chlorobi bacterium]|nr:DUF3857 and transglutaminase domain-containing protein [Chlorobiota bacterium]